ncbi:DegT/DnrJ/EryC1/StrS aminotransferase family protein [Gammaproteobacteria bacterium]|nr:DegT/DnrJ/EryC1/StrS aminotransferase family protein [Gammaproteobacteria bacterium]
MLTPPRDNHLRVPLCRPDIGEEEIAEVEQVLRSGWLTTGPRARSFEAAFAAAVRARHAIALNSCTGALHLGILSLGIDASQAVLVPTLSFASAAQVVRETGAKPILVDCDPLNLNIDLTDADRKIAELGQGANVEAFPADLSITGIIPVHVGGLMSSPMEIQGFARRHQLWIVEDAAHAFPAAWQDPCTGNWKPCGEDTAHVTCYSFYANKTITTGEGGMAVTDNADLANRIRTMSLHGFSKDAWKRATTDLEWDYEIRSQGYKYNMSDVAAAIGLRQLKRSEEMRQRREDIAECYLSAFQDLDQIELPPNPGNYIHSWHLFQIRLRLGNLLIDRDQFYRELKAHGIQSSVHWKPLHLHPLYREQYGWTPEQFPVATRVWKTLLSLPIYSSMSPGERNYVISVVRELCQRHRKMMTA